jgi:regulator of RNase E activity RraA
MDHDEVRRRFALLTTAQVADGCLRADVPVRCAPAALRAITPGSVLAGRALPARHSGSVDVFLEALAGAEAGDVLVIDNGGRLDESCVGDLMALEALAAGLEGIVIWGLHRDTSEVRAIDIPLFSLGSLPTGPLRLDPRPRDALVSASVGEWIVTRDDVVFADEDGVVFVPAAHVDDVLDQAESIRATEGRQAELIREGTTLRQQVRFDDYLAARATSPALTFREHLRTVGGEIEV